MEHISGHLHCAIAESFIADFRLTMFIGAAPAFISAICALLLVEGKQK